ncbi:Telomere-binding protein subunit beta [Gossypium australe]|uniref:Telomere-binding protein subunit beta n=1 Tax=Gossypium australe TaxID=47621 RepID=A0A5B6UGE3_9ROSI|nr:Telomere-binding protein subunit beta [Gossypium australe]
MLHYTTHTSLSLPLFSGFSSMVALPANSREENSPQEHQQRSNANHTSRPNLNVLLPQPRLPIISDSDSEYESDDYFGDEDSEDNEQEEVELQREISQIGQDIENLIRRMDNNLWSMMGDLEDDLEEHIDVLL